MKIFQLFKTRCQNETGHVPIGGESSLKTTVEYFGCQICFDCVVCLPIGRMPLPT